MKEEGKREGEGEMRLSEVRMDEPDMWGAVITCGKCDEPARVWTFLWEEMECPSCERVVGKEDWTYLESEQSRTDANFLIRRR